MNTREGILLSCCWGIFGVSIQVIIHHWMVKLQRVLFYQRLTSGVRREISL